MRAHTETAGGYPPTAATPPPAAAATHSRPATDLRHDGEGEGAQRALQQLRQLSAQLGLGGQLPGQEGHQLGAGEHDVPQRRLALLRKACGGGRQGGHSIGGTQQAGARGGRFG